MRFFFGCAALALFVGAGCTSQTGDVWSTADAAAGAAYPDGPGSDAADSAPDAPAGDATSVPLASGAAALTPDNTSIGFIGTHTGDDPNPRVGGFEKFTGKIEVDPESKTLKSVSVEIDAASLWTPIDRLTNHLNSPDFLDTREYPTITFQSRQIDSQGEGRATITGDLTLHGTTREISFPATFSATDQKLMLQSEFTIDRTQFGMDQLLDRVEPEVTITVVAGKKTQPATAGGPGPGGAGGGRRGPGGNFDPAAMFQRRDANGDGKLTGDEISDRMRENLAEIDANGDGEISQEEFQARLRQFGGRGPGGGPPSGGSPSEDAPETAEN